MSLTAAPVLYRTERVGYYCYVVEKEDDEEFTRQDEETLVMFVSQSARVLSNARKYRTNSGAGTTWGHWYRRRPWGLWSSMPSRDLAIFQPRSETDSG